MHPAFQLLKSQLYFPFCCISGLSGVHGGGEGRGASRRTPLGPYTMSSLPPVTLSVQFGVPLLRQWGEEQLTLSTEAWPAWLASERGGAWSAEGTCIGFVTWTRFFSPGNVTNFCLCFEEFQNNNNKRITKFINNNRLSISLLILYYFVLSLEWSAPIL